LAEVEGWEKVSGGKVILAAAGNWFHLSSPSRVE
jgi:hypothetical protein